MSTTTGARVKLQVDLEIRSMDFTDLGGLEWSGSSTHIEALAEALSRVADGELELVIITLGQGRSIACGAVEFIRHNDAGELSMLSVHPDWQSLGVGTILIGALEERVVRRGLATARISVEHDNPRAAALYRRLGYVADGDRVESWSVGGARTYVTTCTTSTKDLSRLQA